MNLFARRLASVAGAAVIALGIVAPAHAASFTHADATGDVYECGSDCTTPALAATQDPDVQSVKFAHRARKVVITAAYTDLAPSSDIHAYSARIVTNEGLRRDVTVVASGSNVAVVFARPNGDRVRCSGLARSVDYSLNTVRIVVPRSCLSYPRWVKVGYGALEMANPDSDTARADDALTSGVPGDTLVLSPRIKRA